MDDNGSSDDGVNSVQGCQSIGVLVVCATISISLKASEVSVVAVSLEVGPLSVIHTLWVEVTFGTGHASSWDVSKGMDVESVEEVSLQAFDDGGDFKIPVSFLFECNHSWDVIAITWWSTGQVILVLKSAGGIASLNFGRDHGGQAGGGESNLWKHCDLNVLVFYYL